MQPTVELRPKGGLPGLGSGAAGAGASAPGGVPIASLRMSRNLAWPVGQAEVECASPSGAPKAGEDVFLQGRSDSAAMTKLFTGRVVRAREGAWGTRLLLEETTGPLARLYIDKTAGAGSASAIIGDLCRQAGVEAMAEPPGAILPSYALLNHECALSHILRLAELSGMMAATDADGRLVVRTALPVPGGVILRPQDAVVDFLAEDDPDERIGGSVSGDGAFGKRGPGAEAWLLQSLSGITSGSGEPVRRLPAIKTAADAAKAALALTGKLEEARRRRTLTYAGLPPADLGDVLLLMGFGSGDGPCRVAGIELLWDASTGLLTRLDLLGIGV